MPRGYRFLIIAACGLIVSISLATGAYFGALYAPNHKQYQTVAGDQSGQNDYRGPSQSLPDIAGLPGPVERAIANPNPDTGQDHEKRDLAAQEASALWAFWMVLASFLSVVITTIGTIFLYKQISLTREAVEDTGKATIAMERQNEIAEDTARKQLRPYLYVSNRQPPKIEADAPLFCELWLKNVGQTPAHNVRVASFIDKVVPGLAEVTREITDADFNGCRYLPPGTRFVIVCSYAGKFTQQLPLIEEEIEHITAGRLMLAITGEIRYTDASGHKYSNRFHARYGGSRVATEELIWHETGNDAT